MSVQLSDFSRRHPVAAAAAATPAVVVAPSAAEKKKPSAPATRHSLIRASADVTLTEELYEKKELMLALARELGYVCQSLKSVKAELGQQIYSTLACARFTALARRNK